MTSAISVSATTRPARAGEEHGEAYYFLPLEEFEARATAGDFLEQATYNGHRYGTLASEVRRVTQGGKHVCWTSRLREPVRCGSDFRRRCSSS